MRLNELGRRRCGPAPRGGGGIRRNRAPADVLDLLEIQHVDRRTGAQQNAITGVVSDWVSEHPDGTVALPAGAGCPTTRTARWLRRLRRDKCSPAQHPGRKAERIAAHASQIPHISPDHGRLDDAATLPSRERHWRLARDSTTSP